MEVVEDSVLHNPITEDVHVNANEEGAAGDAGADQCNKPNGVVEADASAVSDLAPVDSAIKATNCSNKIEIVSIVTTLLGETASVETVVSSDTETVIPAEETADQQNTENESGDGTASRISDEITDLLVENVESTIINDMPETEESLSESNTKSGDMVAFKTEVLVERNNDVNESVQNEGNADELDASKNILSALQQNLELSDVLQSDVPDHVENNNGSTRQEVLNKEELLDILEGNVEHADDQYVKIMQVDHSNIKTIEAQLALQQLTRLKSSKPRRSFERLPRKKKNSVTEVKLRKDKTSAVEESEVNSEENKSTKKEKNTDNLESALSETKAKRSRKIIDNATGVSENSVTEGKNKRESRKAPIPPIAMDNADISQDDGNLGTDSNKSNNVKENIVNVLVRDWEDDEQDAFKEDTAEKLLEESEDVIKSVEQLVIAQEVTVDQERIDGSSMDSSASFVGEGQAPSNKSGDEGQPQRRLGRVIKKKVIFDPDNPDTFTKGKLVSKNKEIIKSEPEKDSPTPKKSKVEDQQIPKAKSPTGKLQWKKPPPKPSKQNKRLTEVDRLLMDEGAVNMIYQLTPEAPKGKKNMRTKAEFIKKIQSSTPDSKEMKFRERKKECIKSEDIEAKKIVGGKRGSLSSSVKSMSICEDFEAHSADDSIIYRRHSSSSYSSPCMSPLRVNEPDSSVGQVPLRVSREPSENQNLSNANEESVDQISDVFMTEVNTSSPTEVINKSDCLSIKQKLNSKLSHVLNKRKREGVKTDKPAKQKRLTGKNDEKKSVIVKNEEDVDLANVKTVMVTFDQNLAEICVKMKGDQYGIQTLKDLELALAYVDSKEEITVTFLTSECGTLCSSLDLRPILDENLETRTINAFSFAESIRSLLSRAERHSKVLCTGAWGACWGLGLALAALSDAALATERARFALDARAPLLLAAAALTARSRLPRPLVDDLVLFGRELSAEEALRGGLLSRVLWPAGPAQLRAAAVELARQPPQSLLLKKQLLTLSQGEKTFESCLEAERNLVVDYWTSAEGQDALRASLDA